MHMNTKISSWRRKKKDRKEKKKGGGGGGVMHAWCKKMVLNFNNDLTCMQLQHTHTHTQKKRKKKREERLHTKYPPSVKLQALFVLVYPQTSHKHTSPIAVRLLLNRDHFHHLLQRGDVYFV